LEEPENCLRTERRRGRDILLEKKVKRRGGATSYETDGYTPSTNEATARDAAKRNKTNEEGKGKPVG
jgi:hypothetical protein